jgi:hypothetical protein
MPGFTTIELHTLGRVHCFMVRGGRAAAQQWVDCLQLLTKAAAVTGTAVTGGDSPTAAAGTPARRSGAESVVSAAVSEA